VSLEAKIALWRLSLDIYTAIMVTLFFLVEKL
jgi:hypothetical protein